MKTLCPLCLSARFHRAVQCSLRYSAARFAYISISTANSWARSRNKRRALKVCPSSLTSRHWNIYIYYIHINTCSGQTGCVTPYPSRMSSPYATGPLVGARAVGMFSWGAGENIGAVGLDGGARRSKALPHGGLSSRASCVFNRV